MFSTDVKTRTLQLIESIAEHVQSDYSLVQSTDEDLRTLQIAEAIARSFNILPPLLGEVSTVTKSIGTTGRDYSTITSWEADWDNSGIYSSGDTANGEMYNDSVFDEKTTFNGGGTVGLADKILTVATGEEHDGTIGTGARIELSTTRDAVFTVNTHFSTYWQSISANGNRSFPLMTWGTSSLTQSNMGRCLVDGDRVDPTIGVNCGSGELSFFDNIILNTYNDGAGTSAGYGIDASAIIGGAGVEICNNTLHNHKRDTNGNVTGVHFADVASHTVRNNICTDTGGTTGGTKADYSPASASSATVSHNLSSDATASGTGSLTEKSAADQFVSTVEGSEDLHLKSGADAIDAGTDLGTTPTGVNFDIDGRDRDAEGDVWDMGADEFVAEGGGFPFQHYYPGGLSV